MAVDSITACENVCRDFLWMVPRDPRVVQGVLTLFAALVGSATALYIARVVYLSQKAVDRTNEIKKEQREVYRVYVQRWTQIVQSIAALRRSESDDPKDWVLAWASVRRDADELLFETSLSASAEVLEVMKELHQSVYQVPKELLAKIDKFFESENFQEIESERLREFLKSAIDTFGETQNDRFSFLLSLMRSEEFGQVGTIKIEKPEKYELQMKERIGGGE